MFDLVDSHIQHRGGQADEDIIKAENQQAASRKPHINHRCLDYGTKLRWGMFIEQAMGTKNLQ
jgi:hypothetical protein